MDHDSDKHNPLYADDADERAAAQLRDNEPGDFLVGAVAPWQGIGVGHVNDPHSPSVHRAVALVVLTPYGALTGALMPEVARSIGEQLIGHADACTELTLADAELTRLIVPGGD